MRLTFNTAPNHAKQSCQPFLVMSSRWQGSGWMCVLRAGCVDPRAQNCLSSGSHTSHLDTNRDIFEKEVSDFCLPSGIEHSEDPRGVSRYHLHLLSPTVPPLTRDIQTDGAPGYKAINSFFGGVRSWNREKNKCSPLVWMLEKEFVGRGQLTVNVPTKNKKARHIVRDMYKCVHTSS